MCGIVGCFGFYTDKNKQKKDIKSMASTLMHRGPDGWGIYLSPHMALGHTRLSIIDIAGGHQPMISGKYVIAYNGEIYNYIELRQELISKGAHFNSNSDTEVILKAFEVFGKDALPMFNGQFAFLLWDKKEKTLIIARDRYGIRPLYILQHNDTYYFASEMKAFDTIKNYRREFNIQNLYEHALLWNTINDKTVYKNIRSLPGGTFEIYKQGQTPNNIRFYEIGESQGDSPRDINSAKEEFTDLLDDSVRLRLRSDVPVGTYLSGGIDSSVTTYLTAKHNKEKFKTFSVSFADADFDESFFQKEMVQRINSEHYDVNVDYEQINNNFIDAVYHFERPVFRTAPVPLYLLSDKVNQQNIKVVLTGEGADEILFGYDTFKELKLLQFWARQPDSNWRPLLIKKLYPHLMHYKDTRQFGLMRMFYEGFLDTFDNELVGLNIRAHNNKILSSFFNEDYNLSLDRESLLTDIKKILPDNFWSWSLLQRNQFLEFKTLLSGYLLSAQGDRMSMAHSVEGRYPFLDHRLVERLFYFEDRYKLRGFSQKYVLGKAFDNIIPSSIINRPKLPYMAPDLKSFFCDGALTEQAAYFLSDSALVESGLFNNKRLGRLIRKFENQIPADIGYRDNMTITYILSCQMAYYWTRNPRTFELNEDLKKVEIVDYN
jgi:asparagine synthase (glutamine-hydrolysing)